MGRDGVLGIFLALRVAYEGLKETLSELREHPRASRRGKRRHEPPAPPCAGAYAGRAEQWLAQFDFADAQIDEARCWARFAADWARQAREVAQY